MSDLISGKEALIALANGELVEMTDSEVDMPWTEICVKNNDFFGKVEPCPWMFINQPEHILFRIKPQTITINGVELEKPKAIEKPTVTSILLCFNGESDRNVFLNTLMNRNF